MKISNVISDAESVVILAGVGIAAYFVWKGYQTAQKIGNTGKALADKVSQVYTSAETAAGNTVARTEVALKSLVSSDSIGAKLAPLNATPEQIRRDAVNTLDGLRISQTVKDSLPHNAPFTLWRDFRNWLQADNSGSDVINSFYSRKPEGVFYD